jgi:prepilin-type N-terminal cleavage/methylation domain-containing protein
MKGSSLIEVLIALLIFSTAMLGASFSIIQSLKYTRESLSDTKHSIQGETLNDKSIE